jgi:hypothetical protein
MRIGKRAGLVCAWLWLPGVGGFAHAGDASISPDPRASGSWSDRVFFFAGVGVARDSAFSWTGFVGAPLGLLNEDGPRLRLVGGYGRYRYRTSAVPGGTNEAHVGSGELLIGFHRVLGPVAVTAFAGPHLENQRLAAPDAGNAAAGSAVGIKVALELFSRLDPVWIASASVSASTVHRAYHARVALAREFSSGYSVGADAAFLGDARYFEPRVGLLAGVTVGRAVLTLAGGVLSNSDSGAGLYATLSLYAPY